jgi:hypothetical protein
MENYQNPPQTDNYGGGMKHFEPHRGTLVLVFGILGIMVCGVFAILAWIFGNTDLQKMNAGLMDASGRDMTNIGRILGIVGTVLNALGIVIGIVYVVFFMGMMGAAASSGF